MCIRDRSAGLYAFIGTADVDGHPTFEEPDLADKIEAMLRSHGLVRVPPPAPLRVENEAARATAAAPRGPHHDAAPHEGFSEGGGAARLREPGRLVEGIKRAHDSQRDRARGRPRAPKLL